MAKVTEYSRITKMKDNDILLVDGPDGTRTILQTDASKQMGGEVVMVNQTAGDSTKVVINTTDEEIQLATMDDLGPVEEDVSELKESIEQLFNNEEEYLTSDAFTQGGYVATSGAVATPIADDRIRLKNSYRISDKSVKYVQCLTGYSFAVFCWNSAGTFLGKWNGNDFGTLTWHTSLDISGAWDAEAALISIQVSKGDNHTDALTSADGVNVSITKVLPAYLPAVEELDTKKIDKNTLDLNTVIMQNGGIRQDGVLTPSANRVRTADFLSGDYHIDVPDGVYLAGVYFYNATTKNLVSSNLVTASSYDVQSNGYLTKLTFKPVTGDTITVYDVKNSTSFEDIASQVKNANPLVVFDIGTQLRDVSGFMSEIDYSDGHDPIIEQVTSLFDSLAEDYSEYVTKVDAASEAELEYPAYANGIETEGTYLVTPAYKTYLYKFVDSSNALSNNSRFPKKKIFIISGIHGDEQAAPFNAYIFAKSLCTGASDDFKRFRSVFDVYIMPCVNGYGLYHSTRYNANGVNINRNYPVSNWTKSGEPFGADYTGETAGSEFETKLVIAITSLYGFVACFDHHNYAHQNWQFFAQVSNNQEMLSLVYRSLVDCSVAFEKGLPAYFGSGYRILVDSETISTAPGYISTVGTATRWWTEQGIDHSATIEISDRINYENGNVSSNGVARYSSNAFAVGDYTLWSQIFRYCQPIQK